MKLHLPKALFTAVMALFAISPAAYALTVDIDRTYTYDSFKTDGTATVLPDGVTYDATTGVLTGMDSKNLYFTLDMDALIAANANQHVVYITNDNATPASWGINTTEDGTNLTGFWFQRISEDNPAGNWTDAGNADLSVFTPDADNQVVVKASMGSGVGTYLYTLDGDAAYSAGALRTGGTITTLTVNNTFVSSILYNVQSTVNGIEVSNADGTFTRSYTGNEVSLNAIPATGSAVTATILNDGITQIPGNTTSTDTRDIIIGGNGQLDLQTYPNGAISIANSIYIGSTNQSDGALRLAAYSGTIDLNGTITLVEDSKITKETSKGQGNMVTFTGKDGIAVTDGEGNNYTLTLQKDGGDAGKCDYITFAGAVDLGGLKLAGNGGSDITFSNNLQVGKLIVNDGDHKLTFNGGSTQSITIGTAEGVDGIELNEKLELAGSGTITVNGAIRGTNTENAEFIVGEKIIVNADLFQASWSMPTIQIDGVLKVDTFNLSTDAKVSNVSGAGKIQAGSFNMGNTGTYNVNEVRVEVGAGGVKTTANGAYHTVYIGDATFAATTDSWTWNTGKDLALADETTGTTFEVADGKTITIDNRIVNKVVSVTEGEGEEATTTEVTTAGKLIKTGLGTLLLNTNNTYTGDTSVKAGTLEIAANKTMGSTAITVDTDAKLVLNAGTYSNVISGAGQFVKRSDGDVTLNAGDSTFSGDVIVEAGWIKTVHDNALGTGSVTIKEGAGVELTQGGAGAGNLTTNSAINLEGGTLRVQNGYFGDKLTSDITVKTSGTIQSGWGGHSGQIAGAISGTGELTLNQCIWDDSPTDNTWKLTGVVSDKSASEKLSIHSDANVIMSGTNTYSGGTTVTSETLQTASESALGTGKVTVDGGTLQQTAALKVTELEYKSGTVNNNGQALEVGSLTVGSTPMAMAGDGTTTVTDTLTVSNTNAFTMDGALVLTGATVDLSGFTLDTSTAQDEYVYTLGTAARGINPDDLGATNISFTGINVDGYTATLVAQATDPNSPIAPQAESNNYLVLTLTKDQEPVTPPPATELTQVTVTGAQGYDSAGNVLTLTTNIADIADYSGIASTLAATVTDSLWEQLVKQYGIGTLVNIALVDEAGNYFDLDGADNADTDDDVALTINGIGVNTPAPTYSAVGNGAAVGPYVTSYIPEPTTGTLSILALAGLMIRRRRR